MLSYFYLIAETMQIRWDLNQVLGLEPGPNPDWDLKVQTFCLLLLKYFVYLFYLFVCIRSCFGIGDLHCIMQDLSLWALDSLVVMCGLSYPSLSRPGIKPMAPVVEAQSSNHWTTSAFPKLRFLTSVAERIQ